MIENVDNGAPLFGISADEDCRCMGRGAPVSSHAGIPVYLYASWEAVESILFSGKLKATLPENCNDLYELYPSWETEDERKHYEEKIKEEKWGMHCFSLTPNSPAMWGHYADRGRGAVLRFILPAFKVENHTCRDLPIIYIGNRIESERIDGEIQVINHCVQKVIYSDNRLPYMKTDSMYEYLNFVSTKGAEWEYEKEVRIIQSRKRPEFSVRNGDYYSARFMEYLSGIIIGPRCIYDKEHTERLIKTAEEKREIAIWKRVKDDNIYEAHISPNRYVVETGCDETPVSIFDSVPTITKSEIDKTFIPGYPIQRK